MERGRTESEAREEKSRGFCAILASGRRVEGLDKTSPLDQRQIWQCDTPREREVSTDLGLIP